MTEPAPRVYTIAPGVAFVDALAAGLIAEAGADRLALARMTVLLPTRRACRALHDAFRRRAGSEALLLPRLVPIGDIEEDVLEAEAIADAGAALDIPPAIAPLRRRLLLARLILEVPTLEGIDAEEGPAQAGRLAAELARFLDEVETERLDLGALAGLVPDRYAEHWQRSLRFLDVLTTHWPAILAEEGAIDPADRRNRLIAARIEAWRRTPPADPVIAAGSTGSIPATADLLAFVARLPRGAVVLPGFDRMLDEAARADLAPTHPQFGMQRLIAHIGTLPEAVADWPSPVAAGSPPSRAYVLDAALHPTAEPAQRDPGFPIDALDRVERIDCPGAQEEAAVIALLMRERLESADCTAALVTPDRALARRVAAELRRWDILVDDSAGEPLATTPPGVFLRLVADAVQSAWAPVPALALLKHPLAALGRPPSAFRAMVRALETAVLRGPRPAEGIAGLRAAWPHDEPAPPWLDALDRATAPFAAALAGTGEIGDILAAHLAAAEALAATEAETGAERLWAGEAGATAAEFLNELAREGGALGPIAGGAYPALVATLMDEAVVRPAFGRHPRLFIWGTLEARMQHADLVILGGLNEGTWPGQPPADPWLNRDMRDRFGLPSPDRRVGLAAHDFAQAFSAPRVVLSRATRIEGTPTVPARWLRRLDAFLALAQFEPYRGLSRDAEARLLRWQEALDRPAVMMPGRRPRPAPPVAARPRRLSVTEIETWMHDPYAIFARRILGLAALDPIDADASVAERGTVVHKALERFLAAFPDALPEDAGDQLVAIGRTAFGEILDRPGVWAFWWPRFLRVADWVVAMERARRPSLAAIHAERRAEHVIETRGGPFRLIAKADRIERRRDGTLEIIDYKTGGVPTGGEIALGFAPQLPLEAALAAAGAFTGLAPAPVAALAFWKLSGGADPGAEIAAKADPAALAEAAMAGLVRLIETFDDPATPYLATPDPAYPGYGDYDQLARRLEWTSGDGS